MTLCAAYQQFLKEKISEGVTEQTCLLYTSDAADEL